MRAEIDGPPWQALRTRKSWLIAALLVALLASWMWYREQQQTFGVGIVGYNHTDFGIDFYVNGSMGGGIGPNGGGGRHACCVSLPAHYKPGMTVHVLWKSTVESPDGNAFKERDVRVPAYEAKNVGLFAVHFLKNGEIKVLAAGQYYGHPEYPIKDPF